MFYNLFAISFDFRSRADNSHANWMKTVTALLSTSTAVMSTD